MLERVSEAEDHESRGWAMGGSQMERNDGRRRSQGRDKGERERSDKKHLNGEE